MILDAAFDAIDSFRPAELGTAPFWRGHLPFAGFIVALLRPQTIVELGVQNGDSLFAFANAMETFGPADGRIIGVDAWEGDDHVGAQAEWIYARVASLAARFGEAVSLRRARFDEAAAAIPDGSVDLLHIDGSHGYEAAAADLALYRPKLSARGVVLMHDIAVFRRDFGVWKVWLEACALGPHFSFSHSCGLGVLGAGPDLDAGIRAFLGSGPDERRRIRKIFSRLGRLALLDHTPPADLLRVLPIGTLAPPPETAAHPEFGIAVETARW